MTDVARQVQDDALRLLNMVGWFALCGQKAMASELLDRLEAAVRRAMAIPALVRRTAEGRLIPRFEDRGATQRLATTARCGPA